MGIEVDISTSGIAKRNGSIEFLKRRPRRDGMAAEDLIDHLGNLIKNGALQSIVFCSTKYRTEMLRTICVKWTLTRWP